MLRVAVKMEMPVWRFLHTGAHAHGAGANTYRVYVRGVRGLTLTSSGGTAGSTPTSQPNTSWCVHPLQNFASDAFFAPRSRVLSPVLRTLNNASSWSCSSISFCLLTQRVTHKVLRTPFPLESKQARAQRNLISQKPRQGD